MLEASRRRLADELAPDWKVLDVGGWADPFERADWVIDLMPYETRGLYEQKGWIEPREREPERFSRDTWVQRDICGREPWPFDDDAFDFVICAQTLEDVRDPVWVCSEIARVGRAGYIEVPSRLMEQTYGHQGPWVGYGHHHWLIDVDGDHISFTFKHHVIHRRRECHFPYGFDRQLSDAERNTTLWWEGSFSYEERIFLDSAELNKYLISFVEANRHGREVPSRWLGIANLVLSRAGLRRWPSRSKPGD
jgi:hypothetical protein